jgi:hypothetical protein
MAASVLALTAATPLLSAPASAAADSVTITVTVRDDGFSQTNIDARVGDYLIFRLDDAAVNSHTLAWDQGQIRFTFSHRPGSNWRRYGPLNEGTLQFYDAEQVTGYAAGGPFTGVLTVSNAPAPPPPPPPSSSTTTTVTAPPSNDTTTTTAPTTTTSEPTPVQPFLVPDPEPTTTTTAAPNPGSAGAGPTKTGGAPAPAANKDKDKGKSKAAGAETATTLAPAPPAAPPDSIFDAESLTPSPTTLPEAPSVTDPADEQALNAESVLSLLEPEKAVDEDNSVRLLLLGAIAALGMLAVIGGFWWWGHRAARWDPA